MDWFTRVKLGLMLAAAIIFGGSMWTGQDWLRWVAIGLLAAALLLRLFGKPPRAGDEG